jgi:hypothetical protein
MIDNGHLENIKQAARLDSRVLVATLRVDQLSNSRLTITRN